MKAFQFRLQRVLEWRRLLLEREEIELQHQLAALAEIDRARQAILGAKDRAEAEMRALPDLSGADLAALDAFRDLVEKRVAEIALQRADREKQVAAQRAAMLEARRRYRLLERLKERRLEEWRAAGEKELENLAADAYTAQWSRKRPGSSL